MYIILALIHLVLHFMQFTTDILDKTDDQPINIDCDGVLYYTLDMHFFHITLRDEIRRHRKSHNFNVY